MYINPARSWLPYAMQDADIHWRSLDDKYHFSCQFTADLIAMNVRPPPISWSLTGLHHYSCTCTCSFGEHIAKQPHIIYLSTEAMKTLVVADSGLHHHKHVPGDCRQRDVCGPVWKPHSVHDAGPVPGGARHRCLWSQIQHCVRVISLCHAIRYANWMSDWFDIRLFQKGMISSARNWNCSCNMFPWWHSSYVCGGWTGVDLCELRAASWILMNIWFATQVPRSWPRDILCIWSAREAAQQLAPRYWGDALRIARSAPCQMYSQGNSRYGRTVLLYHYVIGVNATPRYSADQI